MAPKRTNKRPSEAETHPYVNVWVKYGGGFDEDTCKYVGGKSKVLSFDPDVTYDQLVEEMYRRLKISRDEIEIELTYMYGNGDDECEVNIVDDRDFKDFLHLPHYREYPVFVSTKPRTPNVHSTELEENVEPCNEPGEEAIPYVPHHTSIFNEVLEEYNWFYSDDREYGHSTQQSGYPANQHDEYSWFYGHEQGISGVGTNNFDEVQEAEEEGDGGHEVEEEGDGGQEVEEEEVDGWQENECDDDGGIEDEYDDARLEAEDEEDVEGATEQENVVRGPNRTDRSASTSTPAPRMSPHEETIYNLDAATRDEIFKGAIFASKKDLKMRLSLHAMKKNFEFKQTKSTKTVYAVSCIDENCGWRLRAIQVRGFGDFRISQLTDSHQCSLNALSRDHKQAQAWVVGEIIKSRYEDASRQYRPKDIQADMRQEYGVSISYSKAYRSRERALDSLRGSCEESYNIMGRFGEMLKITNPGSSYHLMCEPDNHFRYFYMSIGQCVHGFLTCIRPVIALDGTFMKNKYRGTLLVSCALDGNNQIYPIAWGIVDRETDASWTWFLQQLRSDIGEVVGLVFVSDRHSSIAKSVANVFPDAIHGLCVHHLGQNLRTRFRGIDVVRKFHLVAGAYTMSEFSIRWAKLEEESPTLAEYLREVGFEKWARAYCCGRRYNVMTTGIAESINSRLKHARELPVTSLLEEIRGMIQDWFYERRNKAADCTTFLTDYAESLLKERLEASRSMHVAPVDVFEFRVVNEHGKEFSVNVQSRDCSCRKFQLDQLPCEHAIAAARMRNLNLYTLASNYYYAEKWILAYADPIHALGDVSGWPPSPVGEVLPPILVRRIGRRQRERLRPAGEVRPSRRCGRCGEYGHNRQNCRNPIGHGTT